MREKFSALDTFQCILSCCLEERKRKGHICVFASSCTQSVERTRNIPVGPRSPLANQAPARRLPLPEVGAVLAVLLLEHAIVAQVLLAAAARERLHELLLREAKMAGN